MTREEAIRILPDMKGAGNEWDMALDMAITALQAQDVDAVSRQAVMWMLTNLSYTQCRTQGEVEVIGVAKTLLIAMPSAQEVNNSNQEVNNSTATQPNGIESQASYRQVTGKLDVTDCISRQDAIDALNEICDRCGEGEKYNGVMCGACYMDGAVDCIEALPSAQPEIIHCLDCKHKPYPSDNYDPDNSDCGFEIIFPDYRCPCRCDDEYYNYIPDDDWFCGNAERRADE